MFLDFNMNSGTTLGSPQTYSTLMTSITGLIDYKFIASSSRGDMIVDHIETKERYRVGLSSGNTNGKKIKFDVSSTVIEYCLFRNNALSLLQSRHLTDSFEHILII